MMKRSSLAILALLLATAKGLAAELAVTSAWAPKSLTPTATSAAAYLTISNGGEADRIVAVSSPAASMVMIHESKIVDNVATMEMLGSVDVPANSTVTMAPGGLHIMLSGLETPLHEGETLPLEVTFEKAGVVKVDVPVTGLEGSAAAP